MNILLNHRQAGESATGYRHRRRTVAKLVEQALKGKPATESRDKRFGRQFTIPAMEALFAPRKYVPGPHPTHRPHDVTQKLMVFNAHGVPEEKAFTVRHPGTLVKAAQ